MIERDEFEEEVVVEQESVDEIVVGEEKKETALVETESETAKAITEFSADDIKFKIDNSKSMEEQAKDVVGAMATARAVQDEETVDKLTQEKTEELVADAQAKRKEAESRNINAETGKQEANRGKYEAVLESFGIKKHLPLWLLYLLVGLLSPIYVIFCIVIGVPCGVVKILIDNIDNILVRYEKVESGNRPKIKVTVWILIALVGAAIVALTVLKCLGKI